MTKLVVGLALLAGACGSCAPRPLVPMRLQPDTRMLGPVVMDSAAAVETARILNAALPEEGAICYRGFLRDTTGVDLDGRSVHLLVLHLHEAIEAQHDSVTDDIRGGVVKYRVQRVWFHPPLYGCPSDIIATAHSHPNAIDPEPCTHSDDDAELLFQRGRRSLVSLVFCGDGRVEVLYQDTRRHVARWKS